jgi:hypothetical protein
MKKITALGFEWPNTGRIFPIDAELKIVHLHTKWKDLCWKRIRKDGAPEWIYVSTLPE